MKNKEKLWGQACFISETSSLDALQDGGRAVFTLCFQPEDWARGSCGSCLTTIGFGGSAVDALAAAAAAAVVLQKTEDFSLLKLKLPSFCLSGSPPNGLSFLGFFWELVELSVFSLFVL